MANLWGLGNVVDIIGRNLGLGEYGLSEGIAGGPTSGTRVAPTSVSTFGPASSLYGISTRQPGYNTFSSSSFTPTTFSSPSSGGGGGGSVGIGSSSEISGSLRDVNGLTYRKIGNPGQDTWQVVGQAGGSTEASDADLNAIYGGAYSALNAQQSSLEGQLPLTEASIRQSAEAQKTPYEQKRTAGLAEYGAQKTATGTAEANAMQQARQLYNELAQYNQARFGSGSSAGPASMELLGRGTAQQMGATTNLAAENRNKIASAVSQLNDFVDTTKAQIDKDAQLKLDQAKQWFTDQINQINTSRATLESDKAAKRYDALRSRQDFVNQIEAQRQNYALALDSWRQQQEYTMGNQASAYQLLDTAPTALKTQTTTGLAGIPRVGGGTTAATTAPTYANYAAKTGYRQLANGVWVDANGNPVSSTVMSDQFLGNSY